MLHFLGSRVQSQRWDRLWSERGLLTTTECRRDQMGLHRGESVSFCLGEGVCVCMLLFVCRLNILMMAGVRIYLISLFLSENFVSVRMFKLTCGTAKE